jgi:lysozyme
MKPRHKVSRAGIELIKSFEGYRRSAAQLANGRWTIGYGHTKTARQGAEVSEADAEALLLYDLIIVAGVVNELTYTPLTQNQFDALVSFAFNIGIGPFRKSIVLRRVNEGAMLQAAWALEMWRKADFEGEQIVVDALVRRRAAEKALFLTPQDGWVAAPSPVLPPKFDSDAGAGAPTSRPVELIASLVGQTVTVEREPAQAENEPAEPSGPAPAIDQGAGTVEEAAPIVLEPAAAPSQMADAGAAMSARLEALLSSVADEAPLSPARADLDLPRPPAVSAAAPAAASVAPPLPEKPAPVAAPAIAEPELFETAAITTPWRKSLELSPVESEAASESSFEPIPALADLFQRPIYREQTLDGVHPFFAGDIQPAPFGLAPFMVVAAIGLMIFAAATTWAFNPRPGAGVNPMTVGLPIAIVGIACIAWSVYALIARFSGNEE